MISSFLIDDDGQDGNRWHLKPCPAKNRIEFLTSYGDSLSTYPANFMYELALSPDAMVIKRPRYNSTFLPNDDFSIFSKNISSIET
jgi:hypothetical protein